ncbi:unnamed protein product, partial [marine sediment metagenome]
MAKHILKGNNVKLEGRFHLDAGEVAQGRIQA